MTEKRDEMLHRLLLGRYRVIQPLAMGGMGAVYLGRVEGAAGFAKPVVIKRILPHLTASAEDRAQFVREARILSQLRHPSIVNVVDFGQENGAYLMVLEYVNGYHLGQWLKYVVKTRKQMPWQEGVYIILEVLGALQYAHTSSGERAGVIHRDISPSNILLDVDARVRIVDFGVARVETEQTVQDDEHRSSFKGKLPYAAPELYSGATATASTDIYACAVILYQLLAGANPFSGPDAAVIIRRVLALEPAPIDSLRADVPEELAAVLAKALLKDSQSRFLSAKDFSTALRGLLPRSEADIHAEMLTAIRADFSDGLPKLLNVPSLKQLDAAWRAHPIVPESLRVLPSNPTIRLAADSFTGDAAAAPSLSLGRATEALAADTRGLLGVAVTPAPRTSGRPTTAAHRNLLLVAGAMAVAAVATAIAVSRGVASHTEPKYLVVESRDAPNDPSVADGQPVNAPPATPADAKSHASDNPARPTSENTARLQTTAVRNESKSPDPSVALSRAFAKRQAAMQQCFHSNAVDVSGTPEVSVRFRIDTDGTVQSASISPTAIGATPLGQCLVQVARSTNFGPQAQPLTFSIPVTTRKR